MIPPRRSLPVDYVVDRPLKPEEKEKLFDHWARPSDEGNWPEFVDDDEGRKSLLGPAIVLILAVIAVALVWLTILDWPVAR